MVVSTASDLYALSQGAVNKGDQCCHWCGSMCERRWLHDEPPQQPFVRSRSTAKRPGDPYICSGCWFYRMKRITITFLSGNYKDRQEPCNHSWYVTEDDAHALEVNDYLSLYSHLLNPPLKFFLSLRTQNIPNLLHLQHVNQHDEIRADTRLFYSINNVIYYYTIYELEEGLKHGFEGKMPGVRLLAETLGPFTISIDDAPKKKRGRPRSEDEPGADKILKRVIRGRESA